GRLIATEAERPFDLTRGSAFRVGLLRIRSEEHIFLCTFHHIISDGWSRTILFRELDVLYEAFRSGRESPLSRLPIQYADYAQWQQEWLQSDEMREQLAYWQGQFRGELPVLELPIDRPRPAIQTLRGARREFVIPPAVQQSLKTFCREEGVTLFMALLGVFDVLLQRYTGQSDIVVGSLTANRSRVETEGLIGIFINALAIRTDLSGDPTFRELLGRVREAALGAYAHQDLPFEKLVETLHPDRDLSRSPLYQVMLNLDTGPARTLRLPGLVAENLKVPYEIALLDLTLFIRDRDEGLIALLEYNADLFEAATIERMVDSLQTLLQGVVAFPDAKLSTISAIPETERRRLLVEWNQTEREYPRDLCFHQLFERQVERTPDAVAVVFRGETVTYRELNVRANRLARLLAREGVGPDRIVGLLLERGIDLLTAILAVFKSGGAYLPLDPGHPVARIGEIVARSGLRVALTSAALEPLLSEAANGRAVGAPPRILVLDRSTGEGERGEDLSSEARPRSLAYVIFTSGSTGAPKGAMIEHRGMVNHLFAKIGDLELTGSDTVAQTASQCFDISVWQFLAALLVGGRVVVLGDEVAHDPGRLLGSIEREAISIVEVVPSVLRAMLEIGADAPPLSRLRWMIATGEALPAALAREWLQRYPGVPMLNAYGPTECSDDVTHHRIRVPPPPDAANVPIGRPIANTRLYVLDASLSPVPVGVAGELCVGGDGVGRGYLNDPGRTADVFVPDPWAVSDGAHLYTTGDLARFRSDGAIEFLGRIDHQVKVRGFRIELGEIESALSACPGIVQAVCLARDDGAGDKRLVAYVVPEPGLDPSVNEIRASLKRTLPDYMVPAAFVVLESLPLTANGKLDRRRLPVPEKSHGAAAEQIAPRTPVEELLAGIWCQVLGLERVGIFDDFFDLGGHSLLVTQVVARVRATFEAELPLRAVFERPTV
ncbi:MAG TPA: amino acid adenylation domain-containing protein, partial [Thermoanaerobaculia bacterium]|nr:amino acid adenylation domain-containing protein [Thermoanaerobaculia bacterium]